MRNIFKEITLFYAFRIMGERQKDQLLEFETLSAPEIDVHTNGSRDALISLSKRVEALETELRVQRAVNIIKEDKIVKPDDRNDIGFREKVRRKPTKTSSFNRQKTPRTRYRSPLRHTVPSDKEETLRKDEFRNHCLSKAIKCNTVDIINSYSRMDTAATLKMPSWLTAKEKSVINKKAGMRYQARAFLSVLRQKDFHTIRKWIEEESGLDRMTMDHIWKTFQEFNDEQLIMKSLCLFCILRMKIDVALVIDHFFSIEMISEKLYGEINESSSKAGSQNEFWVKMGEELSKFPIRSYVYEALRLAVVDMYDTTKEGDDKEVFSQIIKQIEQYMHYGHVLFVCKCKDICSRKLQPMSVLENMTLRNIYASLPSKRTAHQNSESKQCILHTEEVKTSTGYSASLSSNKSIGGNLQMKLLMPVEEDFIRDDSASLGNIDDRYRSAEKDETVQFVHRRQKKSHRKTSKNVEETNRKTLNTTCDANCNVSLDANPDNCVGGTRRANQTKCLASEVGVHGVYSNNTCDKDISFSSESMNSSTELRSKTHKLFGNQQLAKDNSNGNVYTIKASQVYIHSTHLQQRRSTSTGSGSP